MDRQSATTAVSELTAPLGPRLTRWQRRRSPGLGPALALSLTLVLVGGLLIPESWIRWLVYREFSRPESALELPIATGSEDVVLIPDWMLPSAPPRASSPPRPVAEVFTDDPVAPDEEGAPKSELLTRWTFDPTRLHLTDPTLATPHLAALADSVLRHREFLRFLSLGNVDHVLAMVDTSRVTLAREQLQDDQNWVLRHWAPLWNAQGASARLADIYKRTVTEAERDGRM